MDTQILSPSPDKKEELNFSFTVVLEGKGRKVTEGDKRFVSEEDERNGT